MALEISTAAFTPGGTIPANFTGEGANKSPMLKWSGAPAETQSFALTLEDPDVPGEPFMHWMIYDIPATVTQLEPAYFRDEVLDSGMKQGTNDFGDIGYSGPLPPVGKRHQYVFRLYALANAPGAFKPGMHKEEFLKTLSTLDILERTEISAFYKGFRKGKKAI